MLLPDSQRARIAFILGFALPWRIAIPVGAGLLHPSLFDLLILPFFAIAAFSSKERLARPALRTLPIALFALLALLNARPETPFVAGATAWAALAGWALTRFDNDEALRGLELGTAVSILGALAILPFFPDAVTEGGRFAALLGTKNGFAAVTGILAIRRAVSGTRRDLFVSLGWSAMTIVTGSRGAILAVLGSAIFLVLARHSVKENRRPRIIWLIVLAAGALLALAETTFPSDRYEFASMIMEHWRHIPLLGIGAGSNFGLDLYAKSLLEFGWIGAGLLAIILATALRESATRPLVVFLLLFGLAHDPTRWPLFWFLMAGANRRSRLLHQKAE